MNKIQVSEPGHNLVSYKAAKKPKPPKPSRLILAQANVNQSMMLFGGTPMKPTDELYVMNFKTVYPGGFIGFVLPKNDPRREDLEFLRLYSDKSARDKLRVRKNHVLEEDVQLLAYRCCAEHEVEYVRGLVRSPTDEDEVTLFLVDDFDWVKLPRDELYYAQFEVYQKQFMGIVAELDGVQILQFVPEFNQTMERLVEKYMQNTVQARFSFDDMKGNHKVVVNLNDGHNTSFNDLLLKELLKNSTIEFPNDHDRRKIRGFISHVDKNGTVYIQPKGTVIEALAEWFDAKAEDIINNLLQVDTLPDKEPLLDPVKMSLVYVAPFEGSWCRAKIIKQAGPDKFTVRYIDYGNTATVSRDELYFADQVHPYLLESKLPALATPFHMKFIEEITNVKEVLEYCGGGVKELDIDIRVERVGNLRCVLLRDGERRLNEDICKRNWAVQKLQTDKSETASVARSVSTWGGK